MFNMWIFQGVYSPRRIILEVLHQQHGSQGARLLGKRIGKRSTCQGRGPDVGFGGIRTQDHLHGRTKWLIFPWFFSFSVPGRIGETVRPLRPFMAAFFLFGQTKMGGCHPNYLLGWSSKYGFFPATRWVEVSELGMFQGNLGIGLREC